MQFKPALLFKLELKKRVLESWLRCEFEFGT